VALPDTVALPRVDIIYSYAGADGALIEAAVRTGARGLVSAGLAPGIPARGERAGLEAAVREGVVVVQCSRAASGRVVRRRCIQENGFMAGEDISPQEARVLLALPLARGADLAAVRRHFMTC
jgi:L-asparaginase